MHELRARGVPLVFVSHNLPAVQDLCTTRDAAETRRGRVRRRSCRDAAAVPAGRDGAAGDRTRPDTDMWIARVQLLTADGAPTDHFHTGQPMTIRIGYDTAGPVPNPGFAVDIHRADGVYAVGINTLINKQEFGVVSGSGHVDLEIDALQLTSGCYTLSIGLHRSGGIGSGGGIGLYDLHSAAYPFTVTCQQRRARSRLSRTHWRHETASRPISHSTVHELGHAGLARLTAASQEVAVR